MDSQQIAAWRENDTNGFVVKDYTGVQDPATEEPLIMTVKSCEIWDVLADANRHGKRISVYAIGPRILDLT